MPNLRAIANYALGMYVSGGMELNSQNVLRKFWPANMDGREASVPYPMLPWSNSVRDAISL